MNTQKILVDRLYVSLTESSKLKGMTTPHLFEAVYLKGMLETIIERYPDVQAYIEAMMEIREESIRDDLTRTGS